MISALRAFYLAHAEVVAYMLQSTEYEVGPYLKWYWRTQNFARVINRRVLDKTRRAKLVRLAAGCGMALQAALGITLIVLGFTSSYRELIPFGTALLLSYPIVWAHFIVVPLLLAKWLVVLPRQKQAIRASEKLFARHPAAKIAVAGSYGKTTMKEILATVLSEGKRVAATPANRNVASSHAEFVQGLTGDEDILIIEYGEGAPGDVDRFARTTHPTHAVITGLAPAHLDKYLTLEAAGKDIFSVADYVESSQVYASTDSAAANPFLQPGFNTYGQDGVRGWQVDDVVIGVNGTDFTLKQGKTKLLIHSGLLGRHQIGPLSAAAVLGLELGLTQEEVISGIAKTAPFAHRMQPYPLGGAWILDDTYNGNLEGIRAGTALLGELEAKRKWYVTPGLVDQGKDTASIHEQVGTLIAGAKPDVVVLMKNSVTGFIRKGLEQAGYAGELRIEPEPLAFYMNLEHFVTQGDIVLMQNDWTDNYA